MSFEVVEETKTVELAIIEDVRDIITAARFPQVYFTGDLHEMAQQARARTDEQLDRALRILDQMVRPESEERNERARNGRPLSRSALPEAVGR